MNPVPVLDAEVDAHPHGRIWTYVGDGIILIAVRLHRQSAGVRTAEFLRT